MRHAFNLSVLAPVILFLSVNILLLDIVVFSKKVPEGITDEVVKSRTAEPTAGPTSGIVEESYATEPTQYIVKTVAGEEVPRYPREYYITLGQGTIKNTEWAGVASAEAYVDTGRYPPIKQAFFEAYLSIPTGNGQVFAKLFNVTDKHDVWFSEVSGIGHEVTRHEVPITLENGNKLYRVMLKATLPYEVTVENARIKIVTE